ncbi:hypothetical protein GQ53DRAFT_809638 [Thozetella sp. PMI_491]|nr:hypothetical protein GQ53DRAFT_809638 [Thozetella sp. PMI_491]
MGSFAGLSLLDRVTMVQFPDKVLENGISPVVVVDFTLLTTACIFWCLTFTEMMRLAVAQRSYSLPILSLCINVTWEFLYAFAKPHKELGLFWMTFAWLVFDIAAVYASYRVAAHEWEHSPLVHDNIGLVFITTLLFCFSGHFALMMTIGPDEAYGYSSVSCGIIMEIGSLIQILRRNCTRGISTKFTIYRYLGNWIAIFAAMHRAAAWPEEFGQVMSPFMGWMLTIFLLTDIVYAAVYYKVRRTEKVASKKL